MVSGFNFFWGFFTILCASEGSRSFMGGSDVVHCVRVSTHSVTLSWEWGPSHVVVMGPRL